MLDYSFSEAVCKGKEGVTGLHVVQSDKEWLGKIYTKSETADKARLYPQISCHPLSAQTIVRDYNYDDLKSYPQFRMHN
jgi:hypothetical protein